MTIDDYIKILKLWIYKKTNRLTNTEFGYMEGWFHKTDKEAFEAAIEIMRKYQKIEQILKDIPYGGDVTVRRIQEVIEDKVESVVQ